MGSPDRLVALRAEPFGPLFERRFAARVALREGLEAGLSIGSLPFWTSDAKIVRAIPASWFAKTPQSLPGAAMPIRRSRRATVGLAMSAVFVGLLLATPAVSATKTPKPKISWTLPATADADAALTYSWKASKLPSGGQLVLQRKQGTAGVWRTTAKLTGTSGSGQIKGFPLGTYRFRIASFELRKTKRGTQKKLLAEVRRDVAVYDNVPLGTLLNREGRTFTTPTNTFSYVLGTRSFGNGSQAFTFAAKDNRCRSVHLDFVGGVDSSTTGQTGTISVVQETLDPVTAPVARDQRGSLNANVTPGRSWSVNIAQTSGVAALHFYINGYASCSSAKALGSVTGE